MTITAVPVNEQGAQALLDELRNRYGLDSGDTVSLVDLGGVLVLSPGRSRVSQLAGQIQEKREAAGLGVEDLLEGLDQQHSSSEPERQ